jgi:hypothetical protein
LSAPPHGPRGTSPAAAAPRPDEDRAGALDLKARLTEEIRAEAVLAAEGH